MCIRDRVLIAPAQLAAPLRAGLDAGGRDCAVLGESLEADDDLSTLRALVAAGLRVDTEAAGLAALLPVLGAGDAEPTCVVLSQ